MVEFGFDDDPAEVRCEGCGEHIPAFLDGCPYCDAGEEEEAETWPCPACGALIHPDAQKCSSCGDWVTPRLPISPGARRGRLLVAVLALLALLAALWFLR